MVKQGDVITFWQNDEHNGIPNTHRVIEIRSNGGSDISFVTKGDANDWEDSDPIPGSRLVGVKVLTLPKFGGVLKGARSHPWITVGISAGVMALVLALYIVAAKRAGKKEKFKRF